MPLLQYRTRHRYFNYMYFINSIETLLINLIKQVSLVYFDNFVFVLFQKQLIFKFTFTFRFNVMNLFVRNYNETKISTSLTEFLRIVFNKFA